MDTNLLVVGARPGSIGAHIAVDARLRHGWDVTTAGLHGDHDSRMADPGGSEDLYVDVTDRASCEHLVETHPFHYVVCTAGINVQDDVNGPELVAGMERQMAVNFFGHMNLLSAWLRSWSDDGVWNFDSGHRGYNLEQDLLQWVSISSNSARVARSTSAGYCASKAALSMALRCAARNMAAQSLSDGTKFAIYGYEPGWVMDTPMSEDVWYRLIGNVTADGPIPAAHRIPGNNALQPMDLAALITNNLAVATPSLNGTLLRVDGGEQ